LLSPNKENSTTYKPMISQCDPSQPQQSNPSWPQQGIHTTEPEAIETDKAIKHCNHSHTRNNNQLL